MLDAVLKSNLDPQPIKKEIISNTEKDKALYRYGGFRGTFNGCDLYQDNQWVPEEKGLYPYPKGNDMDVSP